MSKWADNAISRQWVKVQTAPLKSWWADPKLQHDRAAFDAHLHEKEFERIRQHHRFGGSRKIHDDEIKERKR